MRADDGARIALRHRRASPWVEPTRFLRLRWGSYIGRYLGGLTLIVSSMIGLSGANTYVLYLVGLNTIAQSLGWWILPARGAARIWSVGPAIAAMWLLLTGPGALWLLVFPYAGWLWARQRPAVSYLTVVIVLPSALLLGALSREYAAMPLALGIMAFVVVGSAWLARFMARQQRTSSKHESDFR